MKIIQFTEDYLPLIGGIATHVYEISKTLIKMGHNVIVLTNVQANGFKDDIQVIRVKEPLIKIKNRKIMNLQYLISFYKEIYKLGIPDIFHWHTYNGVGPVLASLLPKNVKRVLTNHSSGFLFDVEARRYKYLKRILRPADLIIAPSRELKEKSELFTIKKCVYIPNGVDVQRFYPVESNEKKGYLRNKYNIPVNKNIVLCPRRAVKKNGIEVLIKSIRLLDRDDTMFILVGGGPEISYLKNLVKNLKIKKKVIFVGSVPNFKMVDYYHLSDFVVLPSLKEATSIAGLEAMACGLPLVGTKVGGIQDLIKDNENGFLCRPNDPIDLADKLNLMLTNKNKWKYYGNVAREKVIKNFSWENISMQILDVYKSMYFGKSGS